MGFKCKRVLVTGACGFIGSHLVERLVDEGCSVRAFVYYNAFNSWGWLDAFDKNKLENIEVFCGDIRDYHNVRAAIKGIDVVFHLAALIGIPFSYHAPDSYVDTNIKGTLNVLQACRDYDIERVVVTSTSEVYGTAQYIPIDEKHPLQPQSPYSASKIGADSIAESFYRAFDLPVVIARPFNTYGPRQSARAVIPTIIMQALSGNREIKLGSLYPTRDFNYVQDICDGLFALTRCDDAFLGKVVNIGSGQEITINDLAHLIIKKVNYKVRIVSEDVRRRPEKSEVERLVCDSSLIKKMAGWQPRVALEEGLDKTIAWFKNKENFKLYKPHIFNV